MVAGGDTRHQHSPNHSAGLRVDLSQSSSHAIGVPASGVVYRLAGVSILWKFLRLVRRGGSFQGAVTVIVRRQTEEAFCSTPAP